MALVAYMLGARVFEKHFTLNHAWKGTDHAFSLMPDGMRRFVRDLHRVPAALGDGVKRPLPSEERPLAKMGKKLVAARDSSGRPRARGRRPRREVARRRRPAAVRARRPARPHARAPARRRGGRRARGRRAGRASRSPRASVTALTEIRLAVFDFDGVFTDNRVWTNERGEESVACLARRRARPAAAGRGRRRVPDPLDRGERGRPRARAQDPRRVHPRGRGQAPGAREQARAARGRAGRDGLRRERRQRRRVPRRGRAAGRARGRLARGRAARAAGAHARRAGTAASASSATRSGRRSEAA